MKARIYRFRLDFYYISLIIYLFFLLGYAVIRGTFSDGNFYMVMNDPIIYIVLVFIALFFILLISNYVRSRELLFEDDKFIIRNRFGERAIPYGDILQIRFSREKRTYSEEKSSHRIAKLRLKNRRRWLRIRLADYTHEKELLNEFKNLSKNISHDTEQR